MSTVRCEGCGHAAHRDQCRGKGPAGCLTVLDPAAGEPAGIACSRTRMPCPCPSGACHTCGALIYGRCCETASRGHLVAAGRASDLGALGGTRTPNLLIRSQMLYPLSYERGCK
jgi:hypothetical protein